MVNRLILRRNINEKLFFFVEDSAGNETQIEIKVSELNGDSMKFVLDVPDNVQVLREELLYES